MRTQPDTAGSAGGERVHELREVSLWKVKRTMGWILPLEMLGRGASC